MRMPQAGMRPLTIWETKQSVACKCRCGSPPLYRGQWIVTYPKSRNWRQATGRPDPSYLTQQNFCLSCAAEFSRDNNLPLLPAPRQDPAVGDQWKEMGDPHRVVTVSWLDEEQNGLTVHYSPPLSNGYREVDKQLMWQFVEVFEPVEA